MCCLLTEGKPARWGKGAAGASRAADARSRVKGGAAAVRGRVTGRPPLVGCVPLPPSRAGPEPESFGDQEAGCLD